MLIHILLLIIDLYCADDKSFLIKQDQTQTLSNIIHFNGVEKRNIYENDLLR